jgi:1-acyl-sn-glycerol-3-phosphate acyltransferase
MRVERATRAVVRAGDESPRGGHGSRRNVPSRTRVSRLASIGLGTAALWVRSIGQSTREERLEALRRWGIDMMNSLNVTTVCNGPPPLREGPMLIVSNHVSLLDICALCSTGGTLFVAKEEIKRQPWGGIANRLGNFFHARGNFRDAARVKDQVASALREGWRVTVFAEGKTNDGTEMMPFYSAMVQAAVDACAMVQPVAIRYLDSGGSLNTDVAFGGEQTFANWLSKILGQTEIIAELTFGAPLCAANASRRELIRHIHSFVAAALGLPVCCATPDPHLLKQQVLLEQSVVHRRRRGYK